MMTDEAARDRFASAQKTDFVAQAKWWLNGYWLEPCGEPIKEEIWNWVHKFKEIGKKEELSDLDEFQAHQFLESLGETLTVLEMRERMRLIDQDSNNRMSLLEYLMFKFEKKIEEVGALPQGDVTEELEKAKELVAAAQTALEEMQSRLTAEEEALKQSAEALAASEKAQAEAEAAAEESKKVDAELKAQQDAFEKKLEDLQKIIDAAESTVKVGKAVAERDGLKSEDPLPLKKAKITQEAAVRKSEKAAKAAAAAKEEAASKKAAAEESKAATEVALADAEKKFDEATNYLTEIQKKPGVSHGDFWWMDREMEEKRKYMPKRNLNR